MGYWHLSGDNDLRQFSISLSLSRNAALFAFSHSPILNRICIVIEIEGYNGYQWDRTGFPLRLEKRVNLEKWEGIFQSGKSRGILNRLVKSGKITQITGKLREFLKNFICFVLVWTMYYLLKWMKFSVKKLNIKKILENQNKILEKS